MTCRGLCSTVHPVGLNPHSPIISPTLSPLHLQAMPNYTHTEFCVVNFQNTVQNMSRLRFAAGALTRSTYRRSTLSRNRVPVTVSPLSYSESATDIRRTSWSPRTGRYWPVVRLCVSSAYVGRKFWQSGRRNSLKLRLMGLFDHCLCLGLRFGPVHNP